MAEVKQYPRKLAIPRPELGDKMYRRTLVNQYESALVLSVIGSDPDSASWTATLMTKNGIEFVSSDVEHRGIHDWMPFGWSYNSETGSWSAPAKILKKKNAKMEDPVEATKEASTKVFVLPEPWENEKFMSWRSRAVKSVPVLKGHQASSALLSDAWKNKNYEVRL
jgi:hypothetical protein